MITEFKIKPKYKKENGLYSLDIDDIKIPFKIKERNIVNIPPKQFGGNHSHPRQEAFIGIGSGLKLIYVKNGKRISRKMNQTGKILLFVIPSNIEHAVINDSDNQVGILLEFASGPQKNVCPSNIIKS